MALDGLNSEYTALRKEQGGDSSPAMGSLRSRYNDIRAKVRNQQAATSQVTGDILVTYEKQQSQPEGASV